MNDLKEPLLGGVKRDEPATREGAKHDKEGFKTPRWLGYIY